jgi:hypothetical protein
MAKDERQVRLSEFDWSSGISRCDNLPVNTGNLVSKSGHSGSKI